MKNIVVIFAAVLFICSCSKDSLETLSTDTSTGGSTACFTIMGDYLYTVDVNTLKVFSIVNPSQPVLLATKTIGVNIETIFNNGRNIFIGSQNGFYILNINDPANPYVITNYQHVQSCDPVIADSVYAWVTLNTAQTFCGNNVNELHVVSITNVNSPYLLKTYSMTSPMGLAKNDTTLFVCDGGIKMYDIHNVNSILLKGVYTSQARDVIVNDSILFAIGDDGLSQYRISGYNLSLLSTITVNQ